MFVTQSTQIARKVKKNILGGTRPDDLIKKDICVRNGF